MRMQEIGGREFLVAILGSLAAVLNNINRPMRSHQNVQHAYKKRNPAVRLSFNFCFRGFERIRTAVGAFAELSLATRPRNLIFVFPSV